MLPEVLSNGLCSLNPQVDRLCMVCEMTISAQGKLSSGQILRSGDELSRPSERTTRSGASFCRAIEELREHYHSAG
jgi:ribonuclease R